MHQKANICLYTYETVLYCMKIIQNMCFEELLITIPFFHLSDMFLKLFVSIPFLMETSHRAIFAAVVLQIIVRDVNKDTAPIHIQTPDRNRAIRKGKSRAIRKKPETLRHINKYI